MLGTVVTRKKSGALVPPSRNISMAALNYPLDFFNHTWFGTNYYGFRSDFPKSIINTDDRQAKPGDKIKTWQNTFVGFQAGYGNASVPSPSYNGGMLPTMDLGNSPGYPTLVEKTYDGRTHSGLEFLGPQYLQINGSEIKEAFGLAGKMMYNTGGTDIVSEPYKNSGATFLFVIDNYHIPDTINEAWTFDPNLPTGWAQGRKNALETLMLSKQPGENVVGMLGPDWLQTHKGVQFTYHWPETEDLGVQFFNQGTAWSFEDAHSLRRSNWGPDAATKQPGWTGTSLPTYNRNPLSNYPHSDSVGNSMYGDFENYPQMDGIKRMLPDGLQVVILEYDNLNKTEFKAPVAHPLDIDATGPTVSIYGIGEGWADGHLDVPKLRSAKPAVADKVLWDNSNVFIGGCPPFLGNSDFLGPYAEAVWAGFTGVIYEIQMFEGVLNTSDKRILERIYTERFGSRMQ